MSGITLKFPKSFCNAGLTHLFVHDVMAHFFVYDVLALVRYHIEKDLDEESKNLLRLSCRETAAYTVGMAMRV
jgi:hypothetical protein